MQPNDLDAVYQQAGAQYNVPPALLKAQGSVEDASGDPLATSGAGAVGLAQMMPATAKALGIDPTDPVQSIYGQAQLMRQNYDRYGNWDDALRAYHGGTNQKNWGPLTHAYPGKVYSAMDTSFTSMPIGPNGQLAPGFRLTSDAGGTPFYYNDSAGQMIPASSPSIPGSGSSQPPQQPPDTGNSGLDYSQLPDFGATRFNSGFSLGGPQDQPQQPSVLQDPNYKDAALMSLAGGLASSNPAFAGFGQGFSNLANVAMARTNNQLMMARLLAAYGTPLARMVQAGVPEDTARRVMGLPPSGAPGAQYSAKGMSSSDINAEQTDLKQLQDLSTNRAMLQKQRATLQSGNLHFYPGVGIVSDAKLGLDGAGLPMNTQNAQNYKSFMSTMSTIQGNNLNSAAGVQTDKDAKDEFERLMPNTTNDKVVANHLNNLVNNYATRENQIRERINERRIANKQPPIDFSRLDASNPLRAPAQPSSQLMSDPYRNNNAADDGGVTQPKIGQGGVTPGGTKWSVIGQ